MTGGRASPTAVERAPRELPAANTPPPDPLRRFVEPGIAAPPRTLLIAAHPDDEVIGAGSLLRCNAASTWIVHVTDGAPRDLADARAHGFSTAAAYSRARRLELLAALAQVGVPASRALELHLADQGASFALVTLTTRIAELVRDVAPELVLTHAYEGGHPDHDATAFAVHHAVRTTERDRSEASAPGASGGAAPSPVIAEMAGYHLRRGSLRVAGFLPSAGATVLTRRLDRRQQAEKAALLACFATQRRTLAPFPTNVERFRAAPAYDFTELPHEPPLRYDAFPWGVRSSEWILLARRAREALELGRTP